ncbi:MAG: hypothetical protein WA584_17635 [Pyrinomonadaceae bacterium]
MEYFFTYRIRNGNRILRIGKGHCFYKAEEGVNNYLISRYGSEGWTRFDYLWHSSESAALKQERRLLDDYIFRFGVFPPWNQKRGGGGRQIYVKCKSYTVAGFRCPNDALAGNYNYCGVHRRRFQNYETSI